MCIHIALSHIHSTSKLHFRFFIIFLILRQYVIYDVKQLHFTDLTDCHRLKSLKPTPTYY